jgi:hypothetical protein
MIRCGPFTFDLVVHGPLAFMAERGEEQLVNLLVNLEVPDEDVEAAVLAELYLDYRRWVRERCQ